MRVALAQINPTLGDFAFNRKKIIEETHKALERKCQLVVFPEAALFGYHPFDLLERKALVNQQLKELKILEGKIPKGITVVVGAITINPAKKGRPYFNSAAVVEKGKKTKFYHKQLLPTGDVFDEARFIASGEVKKNIIKIKNKKILITICEDIWAWPDKKGCSQYEKNPLLAIKEKLDLVINLSASPYYPNKNKIRNNLVKQTAQHFRAPTLYVNMVGAQDEIIFDGNSFAVDKNGKKILECIKFEEDLNVLDLQTLQGGFRNQVLEKTEELRQALVLGIRDFCLKTGFKKVHFGLSGGIDSAVIACLAVDALGPANVTAIAMPGPFSAEESLPLAAQLARQLNIQFLEAPIAATYSAVKANLDLIFSIQEFSLVHENLQARIRGMYLMAFSNKEQSLLLATGNKSEYATGYSTLYGDMCGGLVPIGDLVKEQVYDLARLYNATSELIPKGIIDRAPSAELRPNQKDQDTLPEYNKLDAAVFRIVESCDNTKSELDRWLIKSLMRTEFKRWQAPPILKVSKHSFGRGRRYPIAHRAIEN